MVVLESAQPPPRNHTHVKHDVSSVPPTCHLQPCPPVLNSPRNQIWERVTVVPLGEPVR